MLRLLFCLTLGLHTSGVAAKGAYEYAKDIIDWVKSTDKGFVHDKVTAQRYDVDDPESPVGLYAVGDIRHGEVLMSIPREIIITAGDDTSEDYGGIWCPTAFNLIREMRLGDESKFAPYVGYLATQPRGQLPSAWSRAGQNLLQELLGRNDNDASNNLPPSDALEWIKTDWYDDCDGSDDLFEQHAALLLVQRGWDDLMIPLYDMMSHRNGKWLNTECDSVHGGVSIVHVRASRDIQAGEQLYTSYNFCTDCAGKAMGYGTPEILRDYGFVEQYPQRWFFGGRLAFLLDEDEAGSVQLRWLTKNPPTEDEDDFLLKALERLSEFEEVELAAPNPDIPSKELEVMKTYVNATMNAMKLALAKMNVSFFDESQCDTEGGSCNLEMRYDDLGWMEDDINYAVYTCDTDESMDMSGFAVLESLHSHYQKLDFYKDPKNDNVCFDISSVIQMCGSYRPMYHEMVVHYTARFLDKIERVMFVGGGDSMLLHDILKYPSLELVVGLELDQVVTRKSFKHFGTQPHFDNEKVQWWFGDAAKSLLMLPEEYFGSFDMVLVDLSETVMSFLVTDGLDIFQALSLLLKPKGILVKNELYLGAMSKIFDYSVQIHFPNMPVMCSQCLIFGSNNVDFLFDDIRDHNVSTLYVKPQEQINDRYEYVHDYIRNSTSQHLCKEEKAPDEDPIDQKRSPGILMILEAEDVTTQLADAGNLADRLSEAVQTAGLHMISNTTFSTPAGLVVSLILGEGYVMARTWPEHNYCAIDIHLWSSFEKHESAKKALVAALGSKSPSSYRIVAGGMFEVSTWKEDDKKRGPRVVDTCHRGGEELQRDTRMGEDVIHKIWVESLQLIPANKVKIAVVCGDKEHCQTLQVLEQAEGVQAVSLIDCVGAMNEYEEAAAEKLKKCEQAMVTTLMEATSSGGRIHAVIVDASVPLIFARVAYRVIKTRRKQFLDENLFVAMTLMNDESESWRRNFLERFRSQVFLNDTCFRAEILLNSTNSKVELGLLSLGDEAFVSRLLDVVSRIEKASGLVSDVRNIVGGPFVEDPDWKPSHFFAPEDFDQHSPLEQWESQKPLGYQVVYQLETKVSHTKLDMSPEILFIALQETLKELGSDEDGERSGMLEAKYISNKSAGRGSMTAALWSEGNCVALWDGFSHVDLNLFLYSEDDDLADEFSSTFQAKIPNKFTTALQDNQPRGVGRVVNFKSDIDDIGYKPHWARFKGK